MACLLLLSVQTPSQEGFAGAVAPRPGRLCLFPVVGALRPRLPRAYPPAGPFFASALRSGGSAEMGKTTARSLLHAHDRRLGLMQRSASQVTTAPQATVYSTYCEINAARKPLCVCRLATGTFLKLPGPLDQCFYGKRRQPMTLQSQWVVAVIVQKCSAEMHAQVWEPSREKANADPYG